MEVGAAQGICTIAFPGISTCIYGYPVELAAGIAVATILSSLTEFSSFEEVIFCCFSAGDLSVYQRFIHASQS